MRDTIKDEQYFQKYIQYQSSKIVKFQKAIDKIINGYSENERGLKSGYSTVFNSMLHKWIAMYSIGDSIEELFNFFPNVYQMCVKYGTLSYPNHLRMASIAILLGRNDLLPELKQIADSDNETDCVLNFLYSTLESENINDTPVAYKKLVEIQNAINKKKQSEIMETYLESWYNIHSNSSWYDSHKSQNNTYYGYWSFESAAFVKKMALDSNQYKKFLYFPKDLLQD